MHSRIKNYIKESEGITEQVNYNTLVSVADHIKKCILQNNTIYACGNGGSALCASHFVTDLAKMVHLKTDKNIRIVSLVDNIGLITAYANDVSYDSIFSEQLKNYSNPKDTLLAISGSGKSPNVVQAVKYANANNLDVISFTGFSGGIIKDISDISFHIPSNNMQIVEDLHVQALHILMRELVGEL
jgi:D-sedoheptulose 7-phosphate isomerase